MRHDVHAVLAAQAALYGGPIDDRLNDLVDAAAALHTAAERLRQHPSAQGASDLAARADGLRQAAQRAAFAIARQSDAADAA